MDDIVAKAMEKWPGVPDVYGWLGLDRRGNWLLRGERIGNAALNAFISRNYMRDPRGCWYFQNGPQRVFVSLAATPYVYSLQRLQERVVVTAHTGKAPIAVTAAALDTNGALVLDTDLGCGLVHDRDLAIALDACGDTDGAPATDMPSPPCGAANGTD
ncbi:MAG: DUF2946 family protein [Rhodospirillales bacterium]